MMSRSCGTIDDVIAGQTRTARTRMSVATAGGGIGATSSPIRSPNRFQ